MKKILSIALFFVVLAAVTLTVEAQSPKQTAQDRDARQAEREAQREVVQAEREAERSGNQDERTAQRGVQACTRLVGALERMQENVGAAQVRSEEQTGRHIQRITDHRDKKVLIRTRNQERMDVLRAASYERLAGRAQTTEDQASVVAYKSAIESAVTEHRGVVGEAFDVYWDGVLDLVSQHKTEKDGSIDSFELKIGELAQKVQEQCVSENVDISSQDVRSEIKNLRDDYREDRVRKGTLQEEISAVRATYQSVAVAAKKSYVAAVNVARADLQSVMRNADADYESSDANDEKIEVAAESDQDSLEN